MQPFQILMIDDNPGDLHLIQEAFTDCDMAVSFHGFSQYDQAKTYLDTIRTSRDHLPDVIIIDLNLPALSGEEALSLLRTDQDLHATTLVIFSGTIRPEIAHRLKGAGASRVAIKPKTYEEYVLFACSLRDFKK